jgi:predicted Zn-dependent peptidase
MMSASRKTIGLLIIPILLLVLARPLIASDYDLEKKVRKVTLKNGMRVLLMERHISPTVSLYIRYQAGAADETNGRTGAAHLLEHMMFKGTASIGTRDYRKERKVLREIRKTGGCLDLEKMKGNRADPKLVERLTQRLKELHEEHKKWVIPNEIDRLYTENGAEDMNASTGQDVTTYHVSLPSNRIELWARIESDRMTRPVLREFFMERDVIMEERRQRVETDPEGKLSEQFYAAAFQAHPYGRPILGWPADMRFLNMDETEAFFRKTHAPNNTVIAVVGDIDPEETLKLINRYFGGIPVQALDPWPVTEEPVQTGERRVDVTFDAKPQLMIGFHKPAPPSFDDYVLDVAEAVLSKGRTSRLYRGLVETTHLAESIDAVNGLPGARYPSLFVVTAMPRSPHGAGDVEKAVYAELDRLKEEPIPETELRKTKNQMKADYIRHLNSNSGLAGMLSYYEILMGDFRYLTNYIQVIEKISPDDVMQAARKYFQKDNRTVATLVSRSGSGKTRQISPSEKK